MEEQAMPAEAGDQAGDGGVGGSEHAGDLPQGGALGDPGGDGLEEVPAAEPVGTGEGAGGEVTAAVAALEGLEAALIGGAEVEAVADEVPAVAASMEATVGIGTVGRVKPAAMMMDSTPGAHARKTSAAGAEMRGKDGAKIKDLVTVEKAGSSAPSAPDYRTTS